MYNNTYVFILLSCLVNDLSITMAEKLLYIYGCMYIQVYIYVCVRARARARVCVCVCVCVRKTEIRIFIYIM